MLALSGSVVFELLIVGDRGFYKL